MSFLCYLIVGVAIWWSVLTGDERLFVRDITLFAEPIRVYFFDRVSSGELPLWAPWFGGGAPFLADASTQVLYPPVVVTALGRDTGHGLGLFIAIHALFAPVAAHALFRVLGVGRLVTTACALIYGLSGYVLSMTENINYMPAVVWLPLFGAAFGLCLKRGWVWSIAGSLCLVMLVFSGDMVGAGLAVVLGAAISVGFRSDLNTPSLGRALFALPSTTALAIGLSAVQWLPSLELAALSVRAEGVNVNEVRTWALPLGRLAELVQPFVFGSAYYGEFSHPELYPNRGLPWAESVYIGWVAVGLAAVSAWRAPRRAVPLAVAAAAALLLALGNVSGLYDSVIDLVPGLNTIRYPEKWFLGFNLFVIVMAAIGADTLWRDERLRLSRPLRLSFLVGALLVVSIVFLTMSILVGELASLTSNYWESRLPYLASYKLGSATHVAFVLVCLMMVMLVFSFHRRLAVVILLFSSVLDLIWVHHDLPPTIPPRVLSEARESPIWKLFRASSRPRVLFDARPGTPARIAIPDAVDVLLARTYIPSNTPRLGWWHSVLRSNAIVERNAGSPHLVRHFSGGFSPLESSNARRWLYEFADTDPWAAFALANVSYVVTAVSPESPTFVDPRFREIARFPEWNARVLQVQGPLGRARLVPAREAFAPPSQQISRALVSSRKEGIVRVLERRPEHWEFDVSVPEGGYALLVTESFSKGWRATVGGQDVTPRAVAGRFLGVPVPAGQSHVTLTYWQPGLKGGSVVTLLFLALSLLALCCCLIRRFVRP